MTVYFRPCGDLTKAPTPRTPADTALYASLEAATGLTIAIDEEVDYEDWMEPATMLGAAIRSGLRVAVLKRLPLSEAMADPLVVIDGAPSRDMLIGRITECDPYQANNLDFGWPLANTNATNHYPELTSFVAGAGRRVVLADMPGDASEGYPRQAHFASSVVSHALGAAMTQFRGSTCIVKQVYPAKSIELAEFTLPEDISERAAEALFLDKIGYHIAACEGNAAALLVQEKVIMTHETRFFVIDGQVVTGAACIESNTPQQNPKGEVLKAEWEITRGSGVLDQSEPARLAAIRQMFWRFAIVTANRIAAEAPCFKAYSLDLALGADGKPLVIELNPAKSSGLYAIHPDRLFWAINKLSEISPRREPDAVLETDTYELDSLFED